MKTISIHVTQLEKDDKELYYFDELSLFISKIVREMKLFNVKMINLSDYYYGSIDNLKENLSIIIDALKSNVTKDPASSFRYDYVITITVDINPVEFPPEVVCTEDIAEKIEKSLVDKMEIMKELGFIKLDESLFEDVNSFHFIYGNNIGKYLISLIEESIKPDIENKFDAVIAENFEDLPEEGIVGRIYIVPVIDEDGNTINHNVYIWNGESYELIIEGVDKEKENE